MTRRAKYRVSLLITIAVSFVLAGFYGVNLLKEEIPDELKIVANEKQEFDFHLPVNGEIYKESEEAVSSSTSNIPEGTMHLSLNEPFALLSSSTGSYKMDCKLFGVFNIKSVNVEVVEKETLTPCGTPIGIYMETNGVLVVGTGSVPGMDGLNHEPAYHIVQSGDYITKVNGNAIHTKQDLIDQVNRCKGEPVILDVRRNNEDIEIKIEPVQTSSKEYKLGIWVRDNTQGIGTMTFLDNNNGFGALGHGINDVDTGVLMELSDGKLYEAQILSIVKGKKGTPGGLEGMIRYEDRYKLGTVDKNTTAGIFGKIDDASKVTAGAKPMEICLKQNIKKGAAKIRCTVTGSVREFEIEITDIKQSSDDVNKGIVLKVTDPELLKLTGGIVQGMSGSPIIQDGKLVGAVTHVFVQDSTKGYGIFIENMLQSQN